MQCSGLVGARGSSVVDDSFCAISTDCTPTPAPHGNWELPPPNGALLAAPFQSCSRTCCVPEHYHINMSAAVAELCCRRRRPLAAAAAAATRPPAQGGREP
ncbi:hypothetical protein ABPG75_005292 [Micractinium tetrahymenae]